MQLRDNMYTLINQDKITVKLIGNFDPQLN